MRSPRDLFEESLKSLILLSFVIVFRGRIPDRCLIASFLIVLFLIGHGCCYRPKEKEESQGDKTCPFWSVVLFDGLMGTLLASNLQ